MAYNDENLYEETLQILKANGKNEDDIVWVGTYEAVADCSPCIKELFNVSYHDGFGAQVINKDLLVVGKDWWLERHEYDGSEWWEFKRLPTKPGKVDKIRITDWEWWREDDEE